MHELASSVRVGGSGREHTFLQPLPPIICVRASRDRSDSGLTRLNAQKGEKQTMRRRNGVALGGGGGFGQYKRRKRGQTGRSPRAQRPGMRTVGSVWAGA